MNESMIADLYSRLGSVESKVDTVLERFEQTDDLEKRVRSVENSRAKGLGVIAALSVALQIGLVMVRGLWK